MRLIAVGLLLSVPSAGAHPIFTNEPPGMQAVSGGEHPFDTAGRFGCYGQYGSNFSIIGDPSAPASPQNVLRSVRPSNSQGGSKLECSVYGSTHAREIFWGGWVRPSNPFRGWSTVNGNKFVTFGYQKTQIWLVIWCDTVRGCSNAGATWAVYNPQAVGDNRHLSSVITCDPHGAGTCNFGTGKGVEFGAWTKVEVYARASSCTSCRDGMLKVWINGQPTAINHENYNTETGAGYEVAVQAHSWDKFDAGNQSGTDYWDYDHMYLARGERIGGGGGGGAPPPPAGSVGAVNDLSATASGTTVTLAFTQVDDGTGRPAKHLIRYAAGEIAWGTANDVTQGSCLSLAGSTIGAPVSCAITGLSGATRYQFQLVPYRGTLNVDAVFGPLSNVAAATTGAAVSSTDLDQNGTTNVADVQLAINQALGVSGCTTGDVNGDGACNITDVQRVINAVVGL